MRAASDVLLLGAAGVEHHHAAAGDRRQRAVGHQVCGQIELPEHRLRQAALALDHLFEQLELRRGQLLGGGDLAGSLRGRVAQFAGAGGHRQDLAYRGGQRLGVTGRDDQAAAPRLDHLGLAALV